ncbi:MAG: response regulator [Alphaproteobacteria bacterium]|nr:response regulator [Alphaproteobacteria bacterium]MBU1515961.1 response regulator [Alphaproteobacteria bacterium]MBU2092824.1 response regulator [Alphaproteobacteria bacterium]MBU2153651.1 response regulator [Alphaproteobacteria bacterium]MBU2308279.1 response regulator [Alphaproteobacteria bacterium]
MSRAAPLTEEGPPRLLIVDDEAANLQALQSTLSGHGYEVAAFTDPAAALAAFKPDAFDLLLTDLVMPGIGGLTLMHEMRARDPDLAVVIMTGEGSISSAVEAMRDGAMDYVLKPLRLSTLLPVISRALTVRDLRRENTRLEQGLRTRTAELEQALEEVDRQAAERVRAEQALMQAQKVEAIGKLTGGVAHDFNNLLTPIIGYLELLQRTIEESEPRRRFVDTALEAAHRGAKVAGHLLAFSRTQRLNLRAVEVDEALRQNDSLRGHALGAEVDLALDLGAAGMWARTDATQLELAVLNLVVNARDAMPDGGRIELRTRADAEAVTVEVRDTGKGMAPEVLARATEPFFTTKSHQGSGLGLAQVAAFARQCGGRCEIESAVSQGTTVRITLPRAEPPVADAPASPTRTAAVMTARSLSVVVIDDDDQVRQILCDGLGAEGFSVRGAANGPSGLAMVDASPPDAVVLDYAMPGMTGAEVAHRMRVRHPHLPIVFCSGYADSLALDAITGAVVLRKPVTIDDLSSTVRRSVG